MSCHGRDMFERITCKAYRLLFRLSCIIIDVHLSINTIFKYDQNLHMNTSLGQTASASRFRACFRSNTWVDSSSWMANYEDLSTEQSYVAVRDISAILLQTISFEREPCFSLLHTVRPKQAWYIREGTA